MFKLYDQALLTSYTPAKPVTLVDTKVRTEAGAIKRQWLCEDRRGMREWQYESGMKPARAGKGE